MNSLRRFNVPPSKCRVLFEPSTGHLKCNLDNAIFNHAGRSSFLALVRDSNGSCVLGITCFKDAVHSPNMAEVLDLRETALANPAVVEIVSAVIESVTSIAAVEAVIVTAGLELATN
ncbi:hypothetical protein GH714_033484 [Hevea brasiliensis]|uniref:Uncharacterized protein n=1 Tax=Hevea brasiliensis TaxID=3981 RepID=A0A6A6NDV7_HEVBR|nr:hypothetical protein GH714_033484 [Hevea brasiliensis]